MSNYKVKVSIIGDFAVGKSSILNVLNDKMDYCTQSTLGVDFFYKIFSYEEQSYKFHIWDTAGQERFRTIVRSYFRDLDVVILVYDVTDMYSLDNLEKWDTDLEYINKNDNIIKILVGNKIDNINRCISKEDGELRANELNYQYFETSCKNKETITNLFKNIVKIVYERNIGNTINLNKLVEYPSNEITKHEHKKKNNIFSFCSIL
jgi:Ras-related protein Rab-6A